MERNVLDWFMFNSLVSRRKSSVFSLQCLVLTSNILTGFIATTITVVHLPISIALLPFLSLFSLSFGFKPLVVRTALTALNWTDD